MIPTTHDAGLVDPEGPAVEYARLGRTDMVVSDIGFGGCSFADFFVESEQTSPSDVITAALKTGVNYFDTAPWYRSSESVFGDVLQAIPRSGYYIASKVGRYPAAPEEMFDFTYARTVKSIALTLERLRVDSIDLMQIHDPEFAPNVDVLAGTLRALEEARAGGKVRYIGITGYSFDRQRELLALARELGIDVVTSLTYARLSLIDDSGLDWARELAAPDAAVGGGVAMINASTLALGALTPQGAPEWFDFAPQSLLDAMNKARADAASAGVDIARVALATACDMARSCTVSTANAVSVSAIPLTLTGCYSGRILRDNVAASRRGALGPHEVAFVARARALFGDLPARHWEGVEVMKYFAKLGRRAVLAAQYPHGAADGAMGLADSELK